MILGLVGGAGSGKSEAALFFSERGARVLELDRVARERLDGDATLRAGLRAAFGDGIFRPDGTLDRAALRDRVFADPDELSKLNDLHYPGFRAAVDAAVAEHRAARGGLLVLDGAVLFDAGLASLCDRIALIRCREEIRVARIMRRTGLAEAPARAMAHAADRILPPPEAVDRVFDNDGSVEAFRARLGEWCGELAAPARDAAGAAR